MVLSVLSLASSSSPTGTEQVDLLYVSCVGRILSVFKTCFIVSGRNKIAVLSQLSGIPHEFLFSSKKIFDPDMWQIICSLPKSSLSKDNSEVS